MKGYWEPHSSSVDFCEPNYLLTPYIAEPHNVWSSLFITYIAMIGLIYGNPTKEWSIFTMFAVLASIGLGSAGLHTTLHWLPQSSDEVPMLWQVLSILHLQWNQRDNGKYQNSTMTGFAFLAIAVIQTIFYYFFQQIYAVFIVSIIIYTTIIILWGQYKISSTQNPVYKALRQKIHHAAYACFVVFGFSLWVVDMNLCDTLLPYYLKITGFTLHVFWHIFAGLGTYLTCANIIVMRLQQQHEQGGGPDVKLAWVSGFLPVARFVEEKDRNKKE